MIDLLITVILDGDDGDGDYDSDDDTILMQNIRASKDTTKQQHIFFVTWLL